MDDYNIAHVQLYSPVDQSCIVMSQSMPRECSLMRVVLWQTSAILLHDLTCLIYNFESQTWQEKRQFKTDVFHFGLVLSNYLIYVAGGGLSHRDEHNKLVWTFRDDVRCVSVMDIMDNKPAVWRHHATLPQPALVHCYAVLRLQSR